MIKNKKILFICPRFPFPPNDWAKIVVFNTIKQLSKNNELYWITNIWKNDLLYKSNILNYFKDIKFINKDVSKQNFFKFFKSVLTNKSYFYYKYYDKKILGYIDEYINKNDFDIVWLESAYMTIYAPYIKSKNPKIIIISRSHNVEYFLLERIALEEKNFLYRKLIYREASFWRNIEINDLKSVDKLLTITDFDMNQFIEIDSGLSEKIQVLSPWVDFEKYNNTEWLTNEKTLVFIGTMNYMPNIQSIIWFKNEIFDKLLKIDDKIKLYIIWKNPSSEVKELANDNIIVEEGVNDDVFYYNKARIFIVPLLSWSWLKIKVLNALAMWKPIISTKIWTEWINISSDNDIWESDNIKEWVKIISENIWNSDELIRRWENGEKLVRESFDWEKNFNKLSI